MDGFTISVASVLQKGENFYRIIYCDTAIAVLCMMNQSSLSLLCLQTDELRDEVIDGNLIVHPREARRVVDLSSMSSESRSKFLAKRAFIRNIEKVYGPTYLDLAGHARKDKLIAIMQEHKIPRNSAWRYIRLYLQSGMDESVFLRKEYEYTHPRYQHSVKTGRKPTDIQSGIVVDENVRAHFHEALQNYKSGHSQTMQNAFDRMNQKHYMRTEIDQNGSLVQRLLPATERPTLRQFTYFVNKTLSREEKDRIKTSAQEQRNNKRLLFSDNLKNVMGPGDCIEMDEVEVDVSLVSQINPEQTVGRPIVYAMLDVYTRMIIAVSVAFDNNSVLGMTNCLMNLAENKVELCRNYGIHIAPDVWPSYFIPRTIRADRGSEYRSKEAKRIFNELNINLELVPGGSGSLKGSVEQLFRQLHSAQNPLLEGKGLIQKRHDSKHHRQATLTIEDFKRILYNFVVTHNQRYMRDYPLTHDMIAAKIAPIPSALWKYGTSKYGDPRPIVNKDQFFYTLLRPVSARLSRKGITYKGLYYMDFTDLALQHQMYILGTKRESLEMRIDPRDVGALYMLDKQNRLKKVPLNPQRTGNDYQGIPLAEYLELYKAKKSQDKLGGIYNEEMRVGLLAANETAIAEAEENAPYYPNTKGIRGARATEKRLEEIKNSINMKSGTKDSALPIPPEAKETLIIPQNIDEAFDLF